MSRRAFGCLFSITLLFLGLLVVTPLPPPAPAQAAALTGEAVTLPSVFRLVRSNGALVTWSRYAGTSTFDKYEVHRYATAGFTPSAKTLLTTIRDKDVTSWQDTTAAADKSFSYKVVSAGGYRTRSPSRHRWWGKRA